MNPYTDLPAWLWDSHERSPELVACLLKRGRPLRCHRPTVLHMLEDALRPAPEDLEAMRAAEAAYRRERTHHGWRMWRAAQMHIRHRVVCARKGAGICVVWDPGVSNWPRVARILNHCLTRRGGIYKWMRAPA